MNGLEGFTGTGARVAQFCGGRAPACPRLPAGLSGRTRAPAAPAVGLTSSTVEPPATCRPRPRRRHRRDQTLGNNDQAPLRRPGFNRTDRGRLFLIRHDIDVSGRGAALDGGGGHDRRALDLIRDQLHVHKLVGKQRLVGIGKLGAQLHRACGRIDLVVDRHEPAGGQQRPAVAVIGLDDHRFARLERFITWGTAS